MSAPNHYDVLGISVNASAGEIKAAYRRLVKIYHPDINPTTEAKEKIRLINEAFETLSDYYSRSVYDGQLAGVNYFEMKKETPEEIYRREYLRKKTRKERENIENVIKLKYQFYKYERWACMFFMAVGVLFTLDFYYEFKQTSFPIDRMTVSRNMANVDLGDASFRTDRGLYDEYKIRKAESVEVVFSLVLAIPTRARLAHGSEWYKVRNTLHMYNNAFSLIIVICSFIVLANKEYTDFRLTVGIIPAMLMMFLILFAMVTPTFMS